jgi:hypothetical protein
MAMEHVTLHINKVITRTRVSGLANIICIYVCVCVCVYLMVHITKLQLQTTFFKTSLYTTFRMYPSGPWPLKILMFARLVTCEIAPYS